MTTANVLPPTRGALHLADVATRLTMLGVACNRCPRTGRLRIDRLVADYGLEFELPTLRRLLANDCPRWRSHSITDLCGIHFAGLAKLFVANS